MQAVPGHGEFLRGWWSAVRWCAGLTPALERLDDDHVSPTAWARWADIERLFRHVVIGRRRDGEQFAGACEAGLARRSGEQAVVTDAVEPARQDVKQEAADELVGAERHDLLAVRAIAAIILVAEGDAGLVEGEQPPVRDGDAVGVAREIGEHGFGAGEGWLGVDHPAFTGGPARGGAGRPAGRRVVRGCRRRQACRRRGVRSVW